LVEAVPLVDCCWGLEEGSWNWLNGEDPLENPGKAELVERLGRNPPPPRFCEIVCGGLDGSADEKLEKLPKLLPPLALPAVGLFDSLSPSFPFPGPMLANPPPSSLPKALPKPPLRLLAKPFNRLSMLVGWFMFKDPGPNAPPLLAPLEDALPPPLPPPPMIPPSPRLLPKPRPLLRPRLLPIPRLSPESNALKELLLLPPPPLLPWRAAKILSRGPTGMPMLARFCSVSCRRTVSSTSMSLKTWK